MTIGPPHDHVCLAYDDPATLEEHARAFLAAGAAAGQRIWYVGGDAPPTGIDARHLPIGGAYEVDAAVDPERQAAAFIAAFREALADGFTGLRVVAEVTPMVRTPAQRDAFCRYEHRIDRFMTTHRRLNGMCAFHRADLTEDALAELACLHPKTNVEVPFRLHACPPGHGDAALSGELDLSTSTLLTSALEWAALRPSADGEVVLAAAGLRFADHRTLIRLDRWAAARETTLVLRGTTHALARLSSMLELNNLRVEATR